MEVEARKQVEEGKMASEVEPETKPSWQRILRALEKESEVKQSQESMVDLEMDPGTIELREEVKTALEVKNTRLQKPSFFSLKIQWSLLILNLYLSKRQPHVPHNIFTGKIRKGAPMWGGVGNGPGNIYHFHSLQIPFNWDIFFSLLELIFLA